MAIYYCVSEKVRELLSTKEWKAWRDKYERKAQSGLDEPDPYGRCQSPSLRHDAFVRIGQDVRWDRKDKKGNDKFEKYATRGPEVSAIVACCNKNQAAPSLDFFRKLPGAVGFLARLGGRLIVNQADGVIENAGLCLHPHWGYPFIPGSALKGVARHVAWCEWDEERDPAKKRECARRLAKIFGYPTMDGKLDEMLASDGWKDCRQSGYVSFLPAVPRTKANLVADLVNCHHAKYYSGRREKADDVESPIPNFFPAVEAGCQFLFTLVPVRGAADWMLEQAKDWLLKGIQLSGIGSKTAAGYGWFSYDAEENEKGLAEIRLRLQEQDRADMCKGLCVRIDKLHDFVDSSAPEFRTELDAIDRAIRALPGGEGWKCIDQCHRGEYRRQCSRLPAASPLDVLREQWTSSTVNGVVRGVWMTQTLNVTTSLKDLVVTDKIQAMVELLRESSGIGAEVWRELLKTAADRELCSKKKFKHVKHVVEVVKYVSRTKLGLGEMPK